VVSVEDNKRLVARAVAEVINGGELDVVDELRTGDGRPTGAALRRPGRRRL
jgi:hypothetical protein